MAKVARFTIAALLALALPAAIPTVAAEHPYEGCIYPVGTTSVCVGQFTRSSDGGCDAGGQETNANHASVAVSGVWLFAAGREACGPWGSLLTIEGQAMVAQVDRVARVQIVGFSGSTTCFVWIELYHGEQEEASAVQPVPCPLGPPNPGWGNLPP